MPSARRELERQQREREQAISQGMGAIETSFAGFNPQFYNQVRQNQLGSLMPQFAEQYQNTNKSMVFGLANRGLLDSSAARGQGNALGRQTSLGQIIVGNQAQQAANDMQRSVQSEKGNLVNQLIASQDPALAAQQAVGAAASIQAPSLLAPLGNMFQGWADTYLAKRMANTYGGGGGFGGGQGGFSSFRQQGPQARNYFGGN